MTVGTVVVLSDAAREAWDKGSVVEYCPSALSRWTPALITATSSDRKTLSVEFVSKGVCVQHSVQRTSPLVVPLGVNEKGCPPGFWPRASKSRPGQQAFVDEVTGARYGSLALAWKVHLERLLQMESLPTVCDTRVPGKCHFTWPVAEELLSKGCITNDGIESREADIPRNSMIPVKADVDAHDPSKISSDLFFCANVLAESIAAPSPEVIPVTMFQKSGSEAKPDVTEERRASHVIDANLPVTSVLPLAREIINSHLEALPVKMESVESKAKGEERVAELEGALEACRDRVKYLETSLQRHLGEEEVEKILNQSDSAAARQVGKLEGPAGEPACQILVIQGASSPSPAIDPKVVQSNQSSAKDAFNHVFAIERELLDKARNIAGMRRTADAMLENFESLADFERRFGDLQREIKERETRLSEAYLYNEKQEQELEELRLGLKAREEANARFEERLENWECQLLADSKVCNTPHFLASYVEPPPEAPFSDPEEPQRLPRAKAQVPLPRARTPTRSPPETLGDMVLSPHRNRSSRRSPSPPVPAANCHSTPSTSRQCPSGRSTSSTRADGIHAGPSRRPSRTSSVQGGSQRGSPLGSQGFRTPPRSLSPTTLRTMLTPAKDGQADRRLSSASLSGSSVRSSPTGSSATVPCAPTATAPDHCYKLCNALLKKTTYFQPVARASHMPAPARWRAVGVPARIGVGCAGEVTWRTV